MTAGSGIVHAEMFPLIRDTTQNPAEFFQIWLNLPQRDKFVTPHFSMFWDSAVPVRELRDDAGRLATVRIVAGRLDSVSAPIPPPNSWAHEPKNDVAIWTIELEPNAKFVLPALNADSSATLYFHRGTGLTIGARRFVPEVGIRLKPGMPIPLSNGSTKGELLLLQGRPIGEPIARRGPFVMNDQSEIRDAYADYQRTGFGGWPWERNDPIHSRDRGRFAIHADGRQERAI
jgi:redox-sensitive bicupin YhaK (pirin superfamily)